MEGLRKALVINGCSQGKQSQSAPAGEFYTGQLFRMLRKFSELHGFEQRILSGKYGLLTLDDLVDPYDMKISTKADIKRVQKKCLYQLIGLHKTYDTIIIVLGKKYRDVISPILDAKCLVIYSKKGIFGYYTLISHLNQLSRTQALENLSKFRIIECIHSMIEEGLPNTCYFCHYQNENKCAWTLESQLHQIHTPIQTKTANEVEL